jgi:hypothetical protein
MANPVQPDHIHLTCLETLFVNRRDLGDSLSDSGLVDVYTSDVTAWMSQNTPSDRTGINGTHRRYA